MSAITWTTLEGDVLKVRDMAISHMVNCVHMVSRKRRVSALMLNDAIAAMRYAEETPDGASDAARDSAEALIDAAYDPRAFKARLPYAIQISPPVAAMVRRLKRAKVRFDKPRAYRKRSQA